MTLKIEQNPVGGRFALNGQRLRLEDERECLAWGSSPEELIAHSIKTSTAAYAVFVTNEDEKLGAKLCALWGYGSATRMSSHCEAWLLTFPEIEKYRVAFMRASKKAVAYLLELYQTIDVTVDSEYATSIAWLKWLGFEVVVTFPAPTGHLFHTMRRTR